VNKHAFKLFIAKNFAKVLQEEFIIYTFIIYNIIKELTVKHQVKALNNTINYIINVFKTQILFIELKEYEDVFSTENVNKLSLHKKYDYTIEITAKS